MRKAFDLNVPKSKPRLRLGQALAEWAPPPAELSPQTEPELEPSASSDPLELAEVAPAEKAISVPPVQAGLPLTSADMAKRRERLKERLLAVREHPRLVPLPETASAAGELAVERIQALQQDLSSVRDQNLKIRQQLEAAAERAARAEELSRTRVEEAQRLSQELDKRVSLLAELETELAALESERNEALLATQGGRSAQAALEQERQALLTQLAEKEQALQDSLLEEERLAGELELARKEALQGREGVEALNRERTLLLEQMGRITAERDQLLEARRALEAVHRALSQAAVR